MKKYLLKALIILIVLVSVGCSDGNNANNKKMTLDLIEIGTRTGYYTGELKDGLPNGIGKFTTKNPAGETWSYEGEFVNGQFEGKGKLSWEALEHEEGTYKNSALNGKGKYYNSSGKLIYKGDYVDGIREGKGAYYNGDEVTYKGTFKNGEPTSKSYKKACEQVDYNRIMKFIDKYYNAPVMIRGKINQVIEYDEDNVVGYLVAVENLKDEFDTKNFYVEYYFDDGAEKFLKDENVTIWGQSFDTYTYENILNMEVTVPYIEAKYIQSEDN